MQIDIYYLHYWSGRAVSRAKRPDFFNFGDCLMSLMNSINKPLAHCNLRFTLVYDGTEEQFLDDPTCKELKNLSFDFNLKFIEGGNHLKGPRECVSFIREDQRNKKCDLIYILENDYLHSPDWIEKVVEIYSSNVNFDYLSLYDHPDKYSNHPQFFESYSKLKSKLFVTKTSHWRTSPSTCGSYLVKRKIFFQDYFLIKYLPDKYVSPIRALLRNRVLLTPIPGLSTHCIEGLLSPTIDWEKN